MAVYLLKNQLIGADWTSQTFLMPPNRPWVTFGWRFALTGSGSNRLLITANLVTNIQDTGADILFPLTNSRLWEGPRVVTSEAIAANTDPVEGAGILRFCFVNKAVATAMSFAFDWQGAGTRVFDTSLWAEF